MTLRNFTGFITLVVFFITVMLTRTEWNIQATAAGIQEVEADALVLSNGSVLKGKVRSVEGLSVEIEITSNGRTLKRTYPKDRVRSLSIAGRPIDLKTGRPISADSGDKNAMDGDGDEDRKADRSERDVLAEIEELGSTPPSWFESTPLDYPKTLDLAWPEKPGTPWDSSKNVGQYIWDRINPNESRWRSGVRLIDHVRSTSNNPEVQKRAMRMLGDMYHNLHQDYSRAAYWYHQSGLKSQPSLHPQAAVHLADCYWHLGSKSLAMNLLKTMTSKPYTAIKLLGDMGETATALELAEQFSRSGHAATAFLYAGDVCRVAGRTDEAEVWYQKAVEAIPEAEAEKPHRKRDRARAQASIEAVRFYHLDPKKVKDGIYRAGSIGYEAEVVTEVNVVNGMIVSVQVVEHREKQYYSSIADTPRKILRRQSVAGIDATSGATITSEAIINATAKALSQGRTDL